MHSYTLQLCGMQISTIGKDSESLQRADPLSHQRRRSKTLHQQHSHKDWYVTVHQTELITKQKWLMDRQPQRDSDLNVSFFYPEGVSSKVFRSVGRFQSDYIVSHLRRRPFAIFTAGTTEWSSAEQLECWRTPLNSTDVNPISSGTIREP